MCGFRHEGRKLHWDMRQFVRASYIFGPYLLLKGSCLL